MYNKLDNLPKKKVIILFSLLSLFSVILYFYAIHVDGIGLSFDELYSIAMTDYSYGEIYNITAKDVHPPLFYWLLKMIASIFELRDTELVNYRYITAFFYLTTLFVCAFPVRRLFGTGIAFITAVIIVLLPVAFYTYAYVRMYALVVPLLLAMFCYVYDTYKNNTLWAWIKLYIVAIAVMYTHYYALLGAFWMMALYFVLLITMKPKPAQYKSLIKRYIILGFALAISYIPWLIELYKQMTAVKGSYWITKPTLLELAYSLQYYFSPKHFEEKYSDFFSSSWMIAVTYLALFCIVAIIVIGLLQKANKEKKTFGLYASLTIFATVAFILAYSYCFSPVFFVRYLSCYAGLFAISSVIFISVLLQENKTLYKIIVTIFFVCLLFVSGTCYYLNEVRAANKWNDESYSARLAKFMEGTNGIIYTEEIMTPNLGQMSMYYPQYKYIIINDGIVPKDMLYVPDYNDPYAMAPFKLLKDVPEIEIEEYGIYATTHPESIERILGSEYEVIGHLENSILYKFKKKDMSFSVSDNIDKDIPQQ